MAKTVSVAPGKLAAVLQADADLRLKGVKAAIKRASKTARDHLRSATPVDQAQMIKSWKITTSLNGDVTVRNDSPHAGIIEAGAKPHKVNAAGVAALTKWASRHVSEEDIKQVVWGIVRKLEKFGQKGHFILRDSIPDILNYLHEELEAAKV